MIPRDKIMHIAMGIGAVAMTLVVLELAQHNLGAALALMATAFGVFYEAQQWWRGEGTVDPWDAAATAAPGFVAWAMIEFFRRLA
jgi:hypothetical protein